MSFTPPLLHTVKKQQAVMLEKVMARNLNEVSFSLIFHIYSFKSVQSSFSRPVYLNEM